jgi:hypothetical protein
MDPPQSVAGITLLDDNLPHRKHAYGPPLPVTEIALLCYVQMMFVPHFRQRLWTSTPCFWNNFTFLYAWCCSYLTGNTYVLPRPVTWTALLFHVLVMFVPHRKHIYLLPRPVTGMALVFYM